jgi:hypothetical protein
LETMMKCFGSLFSSYYYSVIVDVENHVVETLYYLVRTTW